MVSGLLSGMVLSVRTCWFHNMVTLRSRRISTDVDTCSYRCSMSNFTSIPLYMLKFSSTGTLSCRFIYCYFVNIWHSDVMWSIVSSYCWHSLHLPPVFVFSIFVAWCLVCNAWSCVSVTSRSVSAFRSLPPQYPYERIFFTNKLFFCTSTILSMPYFAFPFLLYELS
jgi:hypothetical protein